MYTQAKDGYELCPDGSKTVLVIGVGRYKMGVFTVFWWGRKWYIWVVGWKVGLLRIWRS